MRQIIIQFFSVYSCEIIVHFTWTNSPHHSTLFKRVCVCVFRKVNTGKVRRRIVFLPTIIFKLEEPESRREVRQEEPTKLTPSSVCTNKATSARPQHPWEGGGWRGPRPLRSVRLPVTGTHE